MVFLPTLSGPAMEEKAVQFFQLHKIEELYAGFDPVNTVYEASRQKVCLSIWLEKMEDDDVEESGVKVETWGRIGQLASRCAWELQEEWRVGAGKLVQNHFSYIHQQSPPRKGLLHVIGEALTTPTGVHHLSFVLHMFDHRQRRVPIGSGTSTLTVVPSESPAAPCLRPVGSPPSSDSSGSSAVTRYSTPDRSVAVAPPTIRSPTSSESSSSTRLSSTPGKRQRLADASPPPSTPSKRQQTPSRFSTPSETGYTPRREHLAPRRVFSPSEHNSLKPVEKAEFMLVNINTVRPTTDKSLEKYLEEFGRIDGMKWEKEFDVEKLCEEESTPFLFHSLPLAEIVQAFFLATLKPEEKLFDDLESLLNTKRHMAKVKEDVVKRILKFVSNYGRKIYRHEVRPYC
ncbi:hypothetical protein CAEBREN_09442 [Caenorhabditis brenneri]|uniref:Uncharacterized protein n=1 Tax=Caenorhabditis brenneri TaxID=135651 RepID=G0N857_CAEBE|nr:hypothetical protein CAEBREN_09442 [Caenorhabditis brenneri]